jgi:DNA-binding NtrC family response regulator
VSAAAALSLPAVLVVDDEPDVLEFAVRALRRRFQVSACGSVDAALDLLGQRQFAVLVTDHKMPRRSGLELLAAVGATHPAMARVLLSGFADDAEVSRAEAAGHVDASALKPIDGHGLLDVVEQAVARRARR